MAFDIAPQTVSGLTASRNTPNCAICPVNTTCTVRAGSTGDAQAWNSIVQIHSPLATPGKILFNAGEPVTAVYTVRAGCIKTFTVDAEGNERVRGFYFPGDIVGLDCLGSDKYPASASAVVASQVCRVPRARMLEVFATAPRLACELMERTSRELAVALALSGDYTADQRVAAFLLHVRARIGTQPGMAIKLPMTRRDIANYLRLATETVCRVLTRFEGRRLIAAEDRNVRVIDAAAIARVAEPVGLNPQPLQLAA